MNPDDFKQTWRTQVSQPRLAIDAELLLMEFRRNEQNFNAMIFARDVREVGISLLLIPVWLFMGYELSLPWTWYLTVPALLWIAGFMLVDRKRHKQQPPEPGEPLRRRVESSLAQVEHQIWLLRNVFWWYLLPFALSILAFFGQVSWQARSRGWWEALAGFGMMTAFVGIVFAGIYWLNQYAVRSQLEPRRQELATFLMSLEDEAADAS
jgi:hypothetical protein